MLQVRSCNPCWGATPHTAYAVYSIASLHGGAIVLIIADFIGQIPLQSIPVKDFCCGLASIFLSGAETEDFALLLQKKRILLAYVRKKLYLCTLFV